ncbi:MAG: HAD hydrolase-like protein [Oscillospiraceae bacterium]|nr:HAD hydrolase-like protein [Oscillospiraceae bacterium]
MYKLVIFDLDGTLLNTLGDLAAAGNYALEQMGKPQHPVEAYKLFVGNGIPKLIHRILPEGHTDAEHEKCYTIFNEYYSAHKADRTVPYSGMKELLERLGEQGVTCVVNTNKAHEFSAELLKATFGDAVRDLIGFGVGYPAKPAPDAATELRSRYGADKNDTLYVGDSSVDMQTAAAAGIDACAVLWGFRSYEELSAFTPKYMVGTTEELYQAICGRYT